MRIPLNLSYLRKYQAAKTIRIGGNHADHGCFFVAPCIWTHPTNGFYPRGSDNIYALRRLLRHGVPGQLPAKADALQSRLASPTEAGHGGAVGDVVDRITEIVIGPSVPAFVSRDSRLGHDRIDRKEFPSSVPMIPRCISSFR